MVLDIIKESLSDLVADLGFMGWLVIGIYAAIFGFSIFRMIIESESKKEAIKASERRQEVRARIDEINLRLAEIRLAREEAEEKLRTDAAEYVERRTRYREDLDDIADELSEDDDWDDNERREIIAEMEAEEEAIRQELADAELEEEGDDLWVIK